MDRLGGLGISLNVEGEPSFSFKTFGHTHPQGCGGWCPAPRMGRRCPEYYCEVGDALAILGRYCSPCLHLSPKCMSVH